MKETINFLKDKISNFNLKKKLIEMSKKGVKLTFPLLLLAFGSENALAQSKFTQEDAQEVFNNLDKNKSENTGRLEQLRQNKTLNEGAFFPFTLMSRLFEQLDKGEVAVVFDKRAGLSIYNIELTQDNGTKVVNTIIDENFDGQIDKVQVSFAVPPGDNNDKDHHLLVQDYDFTDFEKVKSNKGTLFLGFAYYQKEFNHSLKNDIPIIIRDQEKRDFRQGN
jgi:hypothetical protein